MSRRAALVAGLAALAVAVVVAVLLVGGGGGCGDGYPDSPECLAEAFVTRTDASKCDLVEPALLQQIVRVRGAAAARERCARTVAGQPAPEEIEIVEREATGDTVVVEFFADGDEGSITTRRVDGRWRIVSFAE
ncbi:MAG TPA: hypothetical protein VGW10_12410 [Solirubrobacteraceae bacterium]|nr:hypothetical protein [Solirubrobacteraceae bacterium]